jgi:hypothetical protein
VCQMRSTCYAYVLFCFYSLVCVSIDSCKTFAPHIQIPNHYAILFYIFFNQILQTFSYHIYSFLFSEIDKSLRDSCTSSNWLSVSDNYESLRDLHTITLSQSRARSIRIYVESVYDTWTDKLLEHLRHSLDALLEVLWVFIGTGCF